MRTQFIALLILACAAAAHAAEPEPWLRWDHATGDWNNNRPVFEKRGVELLGTYTGQVWGNVAGGIETGAAYVQVVEFGLNADLEKALGWPGGSFRTTWIWTAGPQPSADLVGTNFAISGIEGPEGLRALDLWLQQEWLDGAVALRAGLFNADSEFTISDYAALFLNAGFGWPVLFGGGGDRNPPAYPFASPGVFVAVEPGGGWKFQSAVMQADAFSADGNTANFRWQFDRFGGFLFLNEVHYGWDGAALPGKVRAGVILDSGYVGKPASDEAVWGGAFFYGIIDQALYREPGSGDSPQGLGWFARAGFAPPDRNTVAAVFDTGLTYTGPLLGRDQDAAGIGFGWSRLSPDAAAELDGGNRGNEIVFEATYQIALGPWLTVQPDVQLIVQPGASDALDNALVVGLSASVDF